MRGLSAGLVATFVASSLWGAILPGFRLGKIATVQGFLTSIAVSPAGQVFYTVTSGNVFRLDGATSVRVATVPTANDGNAALLGMAFLSESEAVFHYVTSGFDAEVIEIRNLETAKTIHSIPLLCYAGHTCSSEHHGGNPIVAPDGAVYVGFGDFGLSSLAQRDDSNGGKIFRVNQDGVAAEFARGFRNPFDLVFDPSSGKLLVGDNAPDLGDEIHEIGQGDNAGWPLTVGNQTPVPSMVKPIYVFPERTAPTGMVLLNGSGTYLREGLLVCGFVTKALYYFPDISGRPLQDPITILNGDIGPIIDVAQMPSGRILVANGFGIYKLVPPEPGDADGNGRIDSSDFEAIAREILDGDGNETVRAQEGRVRTSWGADVNGDGVVDARDLISLGELRRLRHRPARP